MSELYYKLIAYKPSGTDTCMGCLMDQWPGHLISETLCREYLIRELVDIEWSNQTKERREPSYSIELLMVAEWDEQIEQELDDLSWKVLKQDGPEFQAIKVEVDKRIQQKTAAKLAEEQLAAQKKLAEERKRKEAELIRLKRELGQE